MYGHGSGFLVSGSGSKPIIQPTQLVFTEANDPLTDRIRMFFMNMNNMTMTKEAMFGCPEKRLFNNKNFHNFSSGSTIDLPILCTVKSEFLNITSEGHCHEK